MSTDLDPGTELSTCRHCGLEIIRHTQHNGRWHHRLNGSAGWVDDPRDGAHIAHPLILACPTGLGSSIIGCGRAFTYDPRNDDGMVDCPYCGICFEPEQGIPVD